MRRCCKIATSTTTSNVRCSEGAAVSLNLHFRLGRFSSAYSFSRYSRILPADAPVRFSALSVRKMIGRRPAGRALGCAEASGLPRSGDDPRRCNVEGW